ncbi:neuropeptide FF receptor 1-like [Alosa alosa]|nr:neuropeptide FF receptor 1 like 3 [Alosa sapidissima]XP_048090847.1 neuropeptide FF receptor 1-like [Alosa alosa]
MAPYYQHSLVMGVVYTLTYLFIFLLCMIGNGLVCVIVLRNHHMRTVTNLFIFNLAISDLLVGIFCIPTTLLDTLITGWPFSNTVCKVSGLVQGMSVCASVFTLVAIAVDRFRCIVYPFKAKLTLLVAKATIGLIWLLALAIMFPSAVMLTVEQEKDSMVLWHNRTYPLYYCYETWPDPEMRKVYTTVLFTHIYLVPLTLLVLLYGRIGAKLFRRHALANVEHPCANPPVKSPKTQRHARVIKMLAVVTLLFMLSWLPLWTLLMLTDYARLEGDKLDLLTGYIFPFSHWLAFSNSSVNPIIYGYFNENFKKGFQDACQTQSCCFSVPGGPVDKRRGRQNWARGPREVVLATNLGVRNRVHTDSDLVGSVHLEMENRTEGLVVECRNSGKESSGSSRGLKSTDLDKHDAEIISPKRAVCCQAWEL